MTTWKQDPTEKYDIREDEEQSVKLNEIIDLLVAAGYFRARIKGLSAFDKVVGGMVWCMENCSFDVNVDLLFQENSTIGQKIALTEKIVTVLPKMECPHSIEPHQIQGLDFIHVFPVIQWLVKRSVKVREERRDFIREHAILEYQKRYFILNKSSKNDDVILKNIKYLQEAYRRRRIYKRRDVVQDNPPLRVQCTLLEYGFPNSPTTAEGSNDSQYFSETFEQEDRLPLKVMGNIVHSQVQKISQVSEQFAKLKLEVQESGASLMRKQKVLMLEKRDNLLEEKIELEKEIGSKTIDLQNVKESLKKLRDDKKINLKDEKNARYYGKLQELILMEENLQIQEREFRDYCKSELERLQHLVQEAMERNRSQENNSTDNQCDEEKEKVQALKLQIAKKNRSIAFLQRQLDEIPGRGELAQYQKRFLELYSQVAQKHEETKQFYTMYNTLDDTKLYLSKELSLLNSVLDNYSEAMTNAIDKEEFMRQFESIVNAIKQNKQKVEKRRIDERNRRDKLSKQLLDLVEQQRNYVAIVKQLKIECKKNEALLTHFRG